MKKHKLIKQTSIITINEWAAYLNVSRHTVRSRINEWIAKGNDYNPNDIYSVLNFASFIFYRPSK